MTLPAPRLWFLDEFGVHLAMSRAKVKAELKRVKANTKRKLKNALQRAYAKVTLTDIRGWFRHCGYSVP